MRSILLKAALPLLSISFITACTSSDEVDELAGETAEDEALDGKADAAADGTYTYFAIRSDVRRCAYPLCGGFMLDRVNRSTTVCHDKSTSEACYTPELDFSESGLSQAAQDKLRLAANNGAIGETVTALVRGRFAPTNAIKGHQNLGRFVVTEVWLNESNAPTDGVFVKVRDNGLRCIAAPCPSMNEKALNTSRNANFADIDWSDANIADERVGELVYDTFEPHGLIIAGSRYSFAIDGRKGKGRTATAAFKKLVEAPAAGACYVGGCSGQICSDQEGAISTCEWRPEYACYQQATCERQADGQCGWTETPELNACLGN